MTNEKITDALSKYKKMLDDGLITQADFDAKKAELLSDDQSEKVKAKKLVYNDSDFDPKHPLSKKENNQAFEEIFMWEAKTPKDKKNIYHLEPAELIEKFKELFQPQSMTPGAKEKIKATAIFKFGPTRACYNADHTAILKCEMAGSMFLGATRNMAILDITTSSEYFLKHGRGYKKMRAYFEQMEIGK